MTTGKAAELRRLVDDVLEARGRRVEDHAIDPAGQLAPREEAERHRTSVAGAAEDDRLGPRGVRVLDRRLELLPLGAPEVDHAVVVGRGPDVTGVGDDQDVVAGLVQGARHAQHLRARGALAVGEDRPLRRTLDGDLPRRELPTVRGGDHHVLRVEAGLLGVQPDVTGQPVAVPHLRGAADHVEHRPGLRAVRAARGRADHEQRLVERQTDDGLVELRLVPVRLVGEDRDGRLLAGPVVGLHGPALEVRGVVRLSLQRVGVHLPREVPGPAHVEHADQRDRREQDDPRPPPALA